MKELVIYHSADMDGICSAAIFKHVSILNDNAVFIGMNYGEEFDWSLVDKNTVVYMADFSFQPWSDMIKLAEMAYHVVWIDHHKSALEECKKHNMPTNFQAYNTKDPELGACASVWKYCGDSAIIPRAILLIAEYDVWKHDDPDCLPFQYGIRIHKDDLLNNEEFALALFATNFRDIITEGLAIQAYMNNQHEIISSKVFTLEFEGFKFAAVNNSIHGSQQLDFVPNIMTNYDGMCVFHWQGEKKQWNVSLYSPQKKVDCSIIAKRYGGGGHAGAAGFTTTEDFFKG